MYGLQPETIPGNLYQGYMYEHAALLLLYKYMLTFLTTDLRFYY